jgi:hypothetical protein
LGFIYACQDRVISLWKSAFYFFDLGLNLMAILMFILIIMTSPRLMRLIIRDSHLWLGLGIFDRRGLFNLLINDLELNFECIRTLLHTLHQ